MWTSTTGGGYHGGYTYGPGPWVDTYRTADGAIVHRGYTYNPDTSSFTVDVPSMWPAMSKEEFEKKISLDLDGLKEYKEERPKMKTDSKADESSYSRKYMVSCDDAIDLSKENILNTVSIMKSKLMMLCAPVKVKNINCKMTLETKNNLIKAYRKIEMYGKELPIIPAYDKYFRRLPDVINIDPMKGMTLNIVDPKEYGELYLEFEGVIYDLFKPKFESIPF